MILFIIYNNILVPVTLRTVTILYVSLVRYASLLSNQVKPCLYPYNELKTNFTILN